MDKKTKDLKAEAKARLFAMIDEIHRRNRDKKSSDVWRDVTRAVEEVRRERREKEMKERKSG